MKVSLLRGSSFWSESRIYATVVWTMITIGTVIIFSGIEPLVLLIIASSGGGVVMAFYSVLPIFLNRRALPEQIRLRGLRLVAIVSSSLVYIGFTLFLPYGALTRGFSPLA